MDQRFKLLIEPISLADEVFDQSRGRKRKVAWRAPKMKEIAHLGGFARDETGVPSSSEARRP
jgi:hypothetical protein